VLLLLLLLLIFEGIATAEGGMLILAPRPGKAWIDVIVDADGSRIGGLAMSAMVK